MWLSRERQRSFLCATRWCRASAGCSRTQRTAISSLSRPPQDLSLCQSARDVCALPAKHGSSLDRGFLKKANLEWSEIVPSVGQKRRLDFKANAGVRAKPISAKFIANGSRWRPDRRTDWRLNSLVICRLWTPSDVERPHIISGQIDCASDGPVLVEFVRWSNQSWHQT